MHSNPTRGLDVGAIEYVHRYLVEQRNKGKAVLLISFELDEIISLSDRIDTHFRRQNRRQYVGQGRGREHAGSDDGGR